MANSNRAKADIEPVGLQGLPLGSQPLPGPSMGEGVSKQEAAISFTRITGSERLSKRIFLDEHNQVQVMRGGNLVHGRYERLSVQNPSEAYDAIERLVKTSTGQWALVYGVPSAQGGSIVTAAEYRQLSHHPESTTIARIRECLGWPKGPGIMMVDFDPDGENLSPKQWLERLYSVVPALARAPAILMPSAGSCIYHADTGEEIVGTKGLRLLVFVEDAQLIESGGWAIDTLAWSSGLGYIKVAKDGAKLVRNRICDSSVWSPERMDFVCGACVEPPLVQRREPQLLNPDSPLLDLNGIIRNAEALEGKAIAERRKAKSLALAQAAKARKEWIQQGGKLGGAQAGPLELTSCGILVGDYPLFLEDGTRVAAKEIVKDRDKYHEARFHDPMEGLAGDDHRVAVAYTDGDRAPRIYTHAHGGRLYYLFEDKSDIVDYGYDPLPPFVRIASHKWPIRDRIERDGAELPVPRKGAMENFEYLLERYGVRVVYDAILKEIRCTAPGIDGGSDHRHVQLDETVARLCVLNQLCRREEALGYLKAVAAKNETNPVVDYLEALAWDGQSRFDEVARTLDASDPSIASFAVHLFLLQACAAADHAERGRAVNRAMRPEFGYVVTLVGGQGLQKTTWFRNLVPAPLRDDYYKSGIVLDPDNKDSVRAAISAWIVELGELEGTLGRSDLAKHKAFLTNHKDEIRLPYDRSPMIFKRRTVFCATVNKPEFLRDKTGNRRYIPLLVGELDASFASVDLGQVWAEAWHRYRNGEGWWPDAETQERLFSYTDGFREHTYYEELLLDTFDFEGGTRESARRTMAAIVDAINARHPSLCLQKSNSTVMRDLKPALEALHARSPGTARRRGQEMTFYQPGGKNRGYLMPPLCELGPEAELQLEALRGIQQTVGRNTR
jgi:hypothetical protein